MSKLEHKMFFTIPQLMVRIEAVFQQLTGNVRHWDDAPHIIFECWEPEQMHLINENIIRGRTPQIIMNIDTSTAVPSFAVFLKYDDPDGFNLTEAEVNLLYRLSGQTETVTLAEGEETVRVMFGNGVDLKDEELKTLVEGHKAHGRINLLVGLSLGKRKTMTPDDPVIVACTGPFTTEPYDGFFARMMAEFKQ